MILVFFWMLTFKTLAPKIPIIWKYLSHTISNLFYFLIILFIFYIANKGWFEVIVFNFHKAPFTRSNSILKIVLFFKKLPCFSHGQFYVAWWRVDSSRNIFIYWARIKKQLKKSRSFFEVVVLPILKIYRIHKTKQTVFFPFLQEICKYLSQIKKCETSFIKLLWSNSFSVPSIACSVRLFL